MGLWVVVALVAAQAGASDTKSVEFVSLSNGMRWLLVPRAGEATNGVVVVKAGGIDEQAGATGVAHLLEHLAFAGTPVVGVYSWSQEEDLAKQTLALIDEFAELQRRNKALKPAGRKLLARIEEEEASWRKRTSSRVYQGLATQFRVQLNAWTTKDSTTYWGMFPPEELHFWLAAEAQRFAAPVFRDFRISRQIVHRERLMRGDPLDEAFEGLLAEAFQGCGYAWPTIGLEADLPFLSPSQVSTFYERHYAPGNAVGVLVGDFDPAQVKQWLAETFELIPARPVWPRSPAVLNRPQYLVAPGVEPWLFIAFPRPPARLRSAAAWRIIDALLDRSPSVLDRLCDGDPCSKVVRFQGPGSAEVSLSGVRLRLAPGQTFETLEAAVFKALRDWKPTEAEFAAARAARDVHRLQLERDGMALASALGEALVLQDDWKWVLAPEPVSLREVQDVIDSLTQERAWVMQVGAP